MILVESGGSDGRAFDAKLLFAAQLARRGHRVVIDERSLTDHLERTQKYEAAPFLGDIAGATLDHVLLIGAEDTSDETLARLRVTGFSPGTPVAAIGRFPDQQSRIGARARIAYAIGREPRFVDLADLHRGSLPVSAVSPLAAPESPLRAPPPGPPRICVILPDAWLDDPQVLPTLAALDAFPDFRLAVVLSGRGKERVKQSRWSRLTIYGYSEFSPEVLAQAADVAVLYGDGIPGERMAAFAIAMLASGGAVIDCTSDGAFLAGGAPALRGPETLGVLPAFLEHAVLVNLSAIGRQARESPWIASRSLARLEAAAGLSPPDEAGRGGGAPRPFRQGRTLFVPTNGIGLGHAQRCARIAAAMSVPGPIGFAAFPSCIGLVRSRGFPCLPLVQKSEDHPEDYANDLVNYLRLRRTLTSADHLVFDGGYVFESIFRTIHETGCAATWIRRGLWRPEHLGDVPAERERAFGRIIVPSEAFPEINDAIGQGARTVAVGPIVGLDHAQDTAATRRRLADLAGREFDTLVVSMLGGGIAADRSAQLQSLCGLVERRPRTLHLVVVWPTARVAPALFAWNATRVVRTLDALSLCRAADLVVSAAGYNAFHELLYHAVPSVFVPQVAPFMDDQERRARSASDRGLAETVLATELLRLDRAIRGVLDDGRGADLRAALARADLPPPGTADAARLIAEGGTR